MINQAILTQIETFEESILQSTMQLLERMTKELDKVDDYMSPKVQSLHRLFLSYYRQYLAIKKQLLAKIPLMNGQPTKKINKNNVPIQNSSKKTNKKSKMKNKNILDLTFPEPEPLPSGLLCPPPNK